MAERANFTTASIVEAVDGVNGATIADGERVSVAADIDQVIEPSGPAP